MRTVVLSLIITVLVLTLVTPASASLNDFAGSWVNEDSNTGGITRLEITAATTVRVHAWGKCTPQDCDWGDVAGIAYGPNVAANVVASAEAITAVFKTSFSETLLVVRPTSGGRLRVEDYTRFTDASGRSNYTSVATFAHSPATLKRFFLRFSDAYLVYEPGSGTLQIAAQSNVLSYGSDWEVKQMQPYLYHLRQRVWRDFYWKINTSRREAYRVTGGTFGQLGGNETLLNMQVEPVGSPENPARFLLRFSDAYLVYEPGSGTLQIAAQSNVLSYGSDWEVKRLQPNLFQLHQQVWRDFFWQVDTANKQAFRVRGVAFGQPGGTQEPLSIRVEPVS